jgi:deoxyribonuclease-4
VQKAPARGVDIGATAIQVFTKTPNQWREPELEEATVAAFRQAYLESGMNGVVAHDSYLINLASPDPALSRRSIESFTAELTRCHRLGISGVVSHPGNYMDDREAGLQRNAQACTKALQAAPGEVMVLLETTAGTGTSLGSRFAELAEIRALVPSDLRHRIGFCADTCHMYSAGYDLANRYDEIWEEWDRVIGLEHLKCFHLNDSKTPFDSHRDRHELIAEGSLGAKPFRQVMRDPRFLEVIKVLETPKGDDMVTNDRRMLRRLRTYGRGAPKPVR